MSSPDTGDDGRGVPSPDASAPASAAAERFPWVAAPRRTRVDPEARRAERDALAETAPQARRSEPAAAAAKTRSVRARAVAAIARRFGGRGQGAPAVHTAEPAPTAPETARSLRAATQSAASDPARNPIIGARGLRARRFSVLVVGDDIAPALEPFRLVRRLDPPETSAPAKPAELAAIDPDFVWRDLTTEMKAAHLQHRRFGGDIASLRVFAAEQGHAVLEDERGAVRIGFWAKPNAKWERWSIGGAFRDRLRVSWRAEPLDQARFGDLDFAAMRQTMRRDAEADFERARANPSLAADLGVDLTAGLAANVLRRMRRHPLLCAALLRDRQWCDMRDGVDLSRAIFDDAWARMFDELIADLETADVVTIVDCQY